MFWIVTVSFIVKRIGVERLFGYADMTVESGLLMRYSLCPGNSIKAMCAGRQIM